jgi:hypothetical protein
VDQHVSLAALRAIRWAVAQWILISWFLRAEEFGGHAHSVGTYKNSCHPFEL